jgi:peptidoglycan/xylan/chitin deacetylase (PgdA/CDA1 family)
MIGADAYSPPRDLISKARRQLTQWRAARPATLAFDRPMLSIAFDDFPASAANEGARMLERHGARGTFYASASLADRDGPCGRNFSASDIRRLLSAGHEIGCHTYSHGDCAKADVFDALHDLARNRDALADMGATVPLRSLAYPYGETSEAFKATLPPRFSSARGARPGLNVGRRDLSQLRAYPLFGRGAIASARQALKRAAKRKAWMIAFTHDVSDAPSPWGTRASEIELLLTTARALEVDVLPVSAALERRRL